MSLETKTKQILENFEKESSENILEVLTQIQELFQTQITRDYLKGKMDAISKAANEHEKKTLCKNLKPYFDWYLQGK